MAQLRLHVRNGAIIEEDRQPPPHPHNALQYCIRRAYRVPLLNRLQWLDCDAMTGVIYARALRGGLISKSGTSMATPHVAGVAALWAQKLLQRGGVLKTDDLRANLRSRADVSPLAPGFSTADVGAGLVRAPLP